MDPVRIHEQYLLSVPGSYELLQKWHPMVNYYVVDHGLDAKVNSLILGAPSVPIPEGVYWYPKEEIKCNKEFYRIEAGDIVRTTYPLITTLDFRTLRDSYIELSPQSRVLYVKDNTVLLPSQSFEVIDAQLARSPFIKALYLSTL